MTWLILKRLLLEKKFQKMKLQTKQTISFIKVLDLNKQQKGKGMKILIPKQILQRSLIALTKWNTSVIYSLYWEEEVTKKV